jgi:peroxiredoxin
VVNPDLLSSYDPPVVPSHLQGRAQLQLAPPTIELSDPAGKNLTVKLDFMARYFPDAHTSPLTEFLRGELQLSAGVDQVVSQQLNMIDVNIKADQLSIFFQQAFPSQPLSAEDSAALTLLIRNALRTGFLPSSNPVPGNIDYLQFKALTGNPNVVAMMLNMASFDPATGRHEDPGSPGDPASVNNNFAGTGDDFALAMGRDFILGSFDPLLSNIRTQPLPPIKVHQWPFGDGHYAVTISQVTPDLQDANPGKLVLTIAGSAVGDKWWTPNFTFTARLAFTLQANGDTVDLVPQDISDSDVDTTSGLVNSLAKGDIVAGIREARDAALRQKDLNNPNSRDVFGQVNDMLSADKNVGQFLRSLLKPPDQQPGVPPPQDVFFLLWYSLAEIKSSGIVLHGSLAVADWPAVHVEFQQIPAATSGGPHGAGGLGGSVSQGSDYSALNSWIPGGTIQQYEWAYQGQTQPYIDANRFVLIAPGRVSTAAARVGGGLPGFRPPEVATPGLVSAYSPLCLTVRGLRYSSSGQVVLQPVSGSACGATTVPVVQGVAVTLGAALMVALTQPGPGGHVEVVGHAAAQGDTTNRNAPNRLVHFGDDKTASSLGFLLDALRESKRGDAATVVLVVLPPGQLTKARYTAGIIYAEDQTGAWARAFGVKTSQWPLTLIALPNGGVPWQQEGQLDSAKLAVILAKYLVRTGPVAGSVAGLSVRIGRPAPNFLLELAPGQRTTLRKIAGRPVTLVFWKSSSKPSIEAGRDLQKAAGKGPGPIVLAINDGEAVDLAKRVAAENELTAALVPDPQRNISLAYAVSIWPTTVYLDTSGLVRSIRYGRFAAEPGTSPTGGKAPASR